MFTRKTAAQINESLKQTPAANTPPAAHYKHWGLCTDVLMPLLDIQNSFFLTAPLDAVIHDLHEKFSMIPNAEILVIVKEPAHADALRAKLLGLASAFGGASVVFSGKVVRFVFSEEETRRIVILCEQSDDKPLPGVSPNFTYFVSGVN